MSKVTILHDFYVSEYGTWKSYEHGVKPGELRVIDKKLYYAGAVNRRGWFQPTEVLWFEMRFEWMPKEVGS